MMEVTRGERGEVVIRVEGAFGSSEASRLAGWLREVPAREPVVVDFADARDCRDFGLAAVAAELAGREQVTLLGLSRHQEKLLRYFGMDVRAHAGARRAAG